MISLIQLSLIDCVSHFDIVPTIHYRDTQQNHCVNVLETITCTQNQLQYIIYQYA